MKEILTTFEGLDHDIGFLFLPTSVANWRKTGNADARRRGLHAANLLAARFNPVGNYIRAWNNAAWTGDEVSGWMIIDCIMNIPLLYWAAKELYTKAALNILKACEAKFCNWNPEQDSIVTGGTYFYHDPDGANTEVPIIYGDYYFIEAILKLKDKELFIW